MSKSFGDQLLEIYEAEQQEKRKKEEIMNKKKECEINKHDVCRVPGGSPHPTKIHEWIPIYTCNLCKKYGKYEDFHSNT
jgi:hypothetical protein